MSRISFLVGFDRVAQSHSGHGGVGTESEIPPGNKRRAVSRKGDERLAAFWEDTRHSLVRRIRDEHAKRANDEPARQVPEFLQTGQTEKTLDGGYSQGKTKIRFLLHPTDPRKLYWDLFVGVMIVYNIVLIPWRIAYKQDPSGRMLYFEHFVDFVFGLDIIISFNSAYFEEDVLVSKRKTIARRYLTTWFVPDLLSTIPLAPLIQMSIASVSSNLQGVKLIRAVRLMRLLKLMRILRLSRKMANVDLTRHMNPAVVRLFKLLAKIVFAAHLLGCMWFMVDECDVDDGDEMWRTCGGSSLLSKYLAGMYWTIATLMSVGYGDISADTNHERLFALVTMVIGSTAFGFIIAMVTVIVETMDPQATAKNAKLDEVREYMGMRKLPKSLQLRMRKHFDHVYCNMSVFREVPILRDLPHALRVKLACDTHMNLMRKLSFFEGLDVAVITEVVYRLKPMQMKRKEYMGKAGDVLDDVFFVIKGRIEARHSKAGGKQVLVALHSDGSDFELSSLVLCRPMQFTYRALVKSEVMWLDKEDLENITTEYTNAEGAINEKAEAQHALLDECLSLDEISDESDVRQAKVLVNWTMVPAERMAETVPELTEDVPKGTMLDREKAQGNDDPDTSVLLRTLRPIGNDTGNGECRRDDRGVAQDDRDYHAPGVAEKNDVGQATEAVAAVDGAHSVPAQNRPVSGYRLAQSDEMKRRITRTEKVTETEEERREERTPPCLEEVWESPESVAARWVILPNAVWKERWDTFRAILIALSVIVVPFRIGFDSTPQGIWLVADLVTDLAFGFDIILSFRTAYESGQVLVTCPRKMALYYLKSWFAIDFLSTVPFDRIMYLSIGDQSGVYRSLKLIKAVRIVRLLRLFRVLKIVRFQGLAEELVELNTVLFRGLKLVLTLALLGHFFGCFWSFVSLSEDREGTGGEGTSWWRNVGLTEEDLTGRYIASIYWAFTTMTTVGYGDIVPVVDLERAYATIIMVIGATVFGYIVGSVSALASNPNGSQALETVKILAVSNYLDEKKVQQKLRQAVKKHVEFFLAQKSSFDEEGLQGLMPPSLRQESVLQIHKDIMPKIAIFKDLNPNHTAYILRHMLPFFCIVGNYIYTAAHGSEGVYFLLWGKAEAVRQKDGTDGLERVRTVDQGKFFGHETFLRAQCAARDQTPQLNVSMRALSECSMFVLPETKILHLIDNHPDLAAKLQRALRRAINDQGDQIIPVRRGLSPGSKSGESGEEEKEGADGSDASGRVGIAARLLHRRRVPTEGGVRTAAARVVPTETPSG